VSALSPAASWALFLSLWFVAIALALAFNHWAQRQHRAQRMSERWLHDHRNGRGKPQR
jgi:hypothetical protein